MQEETQFILTQLLCYALSAVANASEGLDDDAKNDAQLIIYSMVPTAVKSIAHVMEDSQSNLVILMRDNLPADEIVAYNEQMLEYLKGLADAAEAETDTATKEERTGKAESTETSAKTGKGDTSGKSGKTTRKTNAGKDQPSGSTD